MGERIEPLKDLWSERRRAASDFWPQYVYASRDVYGQEFDGKDRMRAAMNDRFKGIDKAIGKAIDTGCVYMRYRVPQKQPELTILTFSDGNGKRFQHTVKMDRRFAPQGRDLDSHDYWWFRAAIAGTILSEGKVKPDPRGGYIPDAIIENADKLQAEFEQSRRTGEVEIEGSVDPETSGKPNEG